MLGLAEPWALVEHADRRAVDAGTLRDVRGARDEPRAMARRGANRSQHGRPDRQAVHGRVPGARGSADHVGHGWAGAGVRGRNDRVHATGPGRVAPAGGQNVARQRRNCYIHRARSVGPHGPQQAVQLVNGTGQTRVSDQVRGPVVIRGQPLSSDQRPASRGRVQPNVYGPTTLGRDPQRQVPDPIGPGRRQLRVLRRLVPLIRARVSEKPAVPNRHGRRQSRRTHEPPAEGSTGGKRVFEQRRHQEQIVKTLRM